MSDHDAILAIVADHERGFNAKDPKLLAAHYREPSWVVSAGGVEVEGRAAILEQAGGVPADQYARFEPGRVEFLGDDVAILHVYVSATDAGGAPRDPGHRMIAFYVFARAGQTWEVVARQDTLTS